MRKWQATWLLVVIFLTLLLPVPSQAQSGILLETLSVELLPEYDTPQMLVIQKFRLPADTSLPVEVTFHIPAEARVNAVAYEQGGKLYYAPSSLPELEQGAQSVRVMVERALEYRIEYYAALQRSGKNREFTYQWAGDYAIRQASFSVTLPEDADAVATIPFLDQQGNKLRGDFASFEAGDPFTVKVEYQRDSDAVQIEGDDVELAEPPGSNFQWSERMLTIWPWALGVAGVALIVGGGLYYWLSGRNKKTTRPGHRAAKRDAASGGDVHCHQCGRRASPGDRFCRDCGTRLRQENP